MGTRIVALALLLGTGPLVAACSDGEGGSRSNANDTQPTVVSLAATDFAYEAPDTVPSGVAQIRLANRGAQPHAATLVRLDAGKTLADYVHAYGEANRTRGERPRWARFLGGTAASGPEGAGTLIVRLEPGNYAWVCFVPGPDGRSHLLAHDQAHAFVVRPATATTETKLPVPTASVRMTEYGLEVSPALKAGNNMIRVENAGIEPHHVLFFRLVPGKTVEDFHAWMQRGMQGEAPTTLVGAMGELTRNAEAFLDVDLPSGEYVLVCLVAGRG